MDGAIFLWGFRGGAPRRKGDGSPEAPIVALQVDSGDAGAEIRGRLAPFNRKGYFGMKEIAYEKRI